MKDITVQNILLMCSSHQSIPRDEMLPVFRKLMQGELSQIEITALTVALKVKGETVDEIAAAVEVMREFSLKVPAKHPENLVDIVGTGGDGAHTFNISTASMFVAAACGAQVAKHGGRSVSSLSGSADLLEALGVRLDLQPQDIAASIDKVGLGFMFAPNHHAAMKHATKVRHELGVRTIFNVLGPLTNPAGAENIMMGVFQPGLVKLAVQVLKKLGAKRALVVWGRDNLDEISLAGPTLIGELRDGEIYEYDIHPTDFGLPCCETEKFAVKDPKQSMQIVLDILSHRLPLAEDIVALNAGAALYVASKANSIAEGIVLAKNAIKNGSALKKLHEFVHFTQTVRAS